MKYLLSGAALLVLVAAGPAWANNVFDRQDVGTSAPEPIGDAEGHALLTDTFSCRLTAGPMEGGLLTGTIAWDMNKGEGTLISGTGVIRKPGSLSRFRLANQRIGFLRFAACADSQGVWHGGKVSGYGER